VLHPSGFFITTLQYLPQAIDSYNLTRVQLKRVTASSGEYGLQWFRRSNGTGLSPRGDDFIHSLLRSAGTKTLTASWHDRAMFQGMFATIGTPQALVDRTQAVIAESIKDPKVCERLDPSGADLVANSPAEFKTWLTGQREQLGKLIKEADIRLQ